MRRYLVIALGTAIAAAATASMAFALGGNTSTVAGSMDPSALPHDKYKGGALTLDVTTVKTGDLNPLAPTQFVTNGTTRTQVDLDDDFKFTTKGLKQCRADLEGSTTADAIGACKSSKVGTGSAVVCVNNGFGGCVNSGVPSVVTAFNGKPTGSGLPTLILHSRIEFGPINQTTLLKGVLRDSPLGGDFGKRLDVPVDLPVGTAITDFLVTVKKTFTVDGHKKRYIAARCHDGNHKLNYGATFTYADLTVDPVLANQTCTVG